MDLLIRILVVVFACIGFSVVLGGAAAWLDVKDEERRYRKASRAARET